MRLLDTTIKELREFQSNIPVYAILSHVWGKEEVTFRDIADLDKAKKMHGFAKILGACDTAIKGGFKYIWIDTCCINKESSAELSEAINSMCAWYKNAAVCYAYLSDVPSKDDHKNPCSLFTMSLWFTRGWTLQELIAPSQVVFYGKDWVDIGTKATLQKTISAVTGISTEIIVGVSTLDKVPIAVRMSWAANRNTTREEDVAYSLMGLFDVNMPLLYGEGMKAFIRLQHEIIKKSDDHSIFAWTPIDRYRKQGILAPSPHEFFDSGNVERIPRPSLSPGHGQSHSTGNTHSSRPYSITNRGLHIELPIMGPDPDDKRVPIPISAFLNCRFSGKSNPIVLTLIPSKSLEPSDYVRSDTELLEHDLALGGSVRISSLYIADDFLPEIRLNSVNVAWNFDVPTEYGSLSVNGDNYSAEGTWVSTLFGSEAAIMVLEEPHKAERFAVLVGTGKAIWCDILVDIRDEHQNDILTSYDSARGTRWARKTQCLDRASAGLADGWSVHISTMFVGPDKSACRVQIKIKQSPRQRSPTPPLKRPDGSVGCLVIPPAPDSGFVVDTSNLQQSSRYINWVQHLGSFILYLPAAKDLEGGYLSTKIGLPIGVLTFKGTEEEFTLLVDPSFRNIHSGIERMRPEQPFNALHNNKNCYEATYRVLLDGGKLVFVTVGRCRENSVADYIIRLTI